MSNLNELFNKHSRVHPWAETDNKKTLDLEGLEAVIAEMMPSDEEIRREASAQYPKANSKEESDPTEHAERMGFIYGIKHLRSTLLGSDKNG
jgi:hypothetical protein